MPFVKQRAEGTKPTDFNRNIMSVNHKDTNLASS